MPTLAAKSFRFRAEVAVWAAFTDCIAVLGEAFAWEAIAVRAQEESISWEGAHWLCNCQGSIASATSEANSLKFLLRTARRSAMLFS